MATSRRKICGDVVLVFAGLLGVIQGCGGEAETPKAGTEKFEEDKKAYQNVRAQEYGRPMFDPAKDKAKAKAK